ncbi:alpha-xylosidase [Lachnotalea sp. AF33-28]|uniref:alpha-xylosidase n=1 Tax=Lachnotalea sp. AF33-28 TaxID=2292046 RepID=UPI000E48C469|nr:alpha-xylosidase [Lachnotalea sp. AF33-28]RHP34612.1 alpha-xylosidase [Lachnotalea sp. AF33-28]
MKFTDGYWVTKPEYRPEFVEEIYCAKRYGDGLRAYGPYRRITDRGATLNIGQMTVTVTAPMENVLKVHLANHMGSYITTPVYELCGDQEFHAAVETDQDGARIMSGSLALELKKGSPQLNFLADGRPLTKAAPRSTSMMHHRDGKNYLVTGLSLDTGELVYGLGERFTPFVKNGQNVDMWNEDGGTASEISYKNIPFYMTSKGYGVFVRHSGRVSFEVGSEKVETVQFSVEGEELEYCLIYGPTPKEIILRYTALTGRAPLLPKWSFGLWLTTSFITDYDEKTVSYFIDGMEERGIPLHVFHFDCFWMKGFHWCDFQWDEEMFPDPEGMLGRLHDRGLKVCVWINPYIAQQSPLFEEGMKKHYLLMREDGCVWQWDMWQAGMAVVDFTNPEAWDWYQEKLKALLDMGVDCFKTDFGERIPVNVRYHDGSDPVKMHNYYTLLYNRCVFQLLEREKGRADAVIFARSATAGGQQYPVHWGGDSTSQYVSMAESLRGGLSLMDSGFAFWSHDIGGFEDSGSPDLYKRWVAFGMLSSHSRLHGSSSYRVPWNYDEEACEVLKAFTKLKCRLMPYLYTAAVRAHLTGIPVMRPMHMEFWQDRNCAYLDRQYMLGDSVLAAPVFSEDGEESCYLPEGTWTHLLSGKIVEGGRWFTDRYDYFSLPLFVKDGSILPFGKCDITPDYELADRAEYRVYGIKKDAYTEIWDSDGQKKASLTMKVLDGALRFRMEGKENGRVLLSGVFSVREAWNCETERTEAGVCLIPKSGEFGITLR